MSSGPAPIGFAECYQVDRTASDDQEVGVCDFPSPIGAAATVS